MVADAYFGLYRISADFKTSEMLVPSTEVFDGRRNVLTNNLAVSPTTGDVFFTVSDTRYGNNNSVLSSFLAPSGRLMRYDAAAGKAAVLADGINLPNGIILGPGEGHLLMSETG